MDRQRIDKWLWHARLVRTRSAASELAGSGRVRVNGDRINAASKAVRAGDVVTVTLDRVRVLKILSFSERRGSAEVAMGLYEDLAPLLPPTEQALPGPALRELGSGRPTKRERRDIVRLKRPQDA